MSPRLDVKPPVPQAAMRETPDVKEFLFNPMVDVGKKRDLLSSLANDAGLSKHTLNFLNLLLDSDRLVAVESIFDEFQAAYCRLTDTQAREPEFQVILTSSPCSRLALPEISSETLKSLRCFSHRL